MSELASVDATTIQQGLMRFVLIFLALFSSAQAWKAPAVINRGVIRPAVVATAILASSVPVVPVLSASAALPLSASDLIQSDLNEDKEILSNVLQVFKLNRGLVDSKDYQSVRTSMRSGSVNSLRKTCKQLCKVLSSEEQQKEFNDGYENMISNLNEFDTLVTKRLQRTGIPAADAKDEELSADLDALVTSFEAMLKTI